MNDSLMQVREIAAMALPRHRRWRRLLKGLTIDPDQLPRPLASPGPNDFIICGAPRSGTTLVASLLFQPPRAITVNEPWDGMRLPPRELFASLRREIESTGALGRGRLDFDALMANGDVTWRRDGEVRQRLDLDPECRLGVKWPAFWRYLEYLPDTKFVVCLRHPAEVARSCRLKQGRLVQGLDYDIPFNRAMNEELRRATPDWAVRRVLLYDYIYQRVLPHLDRPNVMAVRYERWFTERGRIVGELGRFLGVELDEGFARIKAGGPVANDGSDASVVRSYCRSAAALGYSLESP